MRTIKVTATYEYTLEVDDESTIVKEYKSTKERVSDLVHYRFDILPVINHGVKIKDVEVEDFEFREQ